MIVGRSRSVDVTVADEEVGRKQFKIGVTSGFVVLEGLGATNPTRVDDSIIKVGEKTTLPPGATIKVGKSEFVVESADATVDQAADAPDVPQNTMVAGPGAPGFPGGGGVPATGGVPGAAGAPGGAASANGDAPMNTMEFQTPGGPGLPGAPATPGGADAPMNTMEFRPPGLPGGPGAKAPGPATPPPPVGGETSAGGPPRPGSGPGGPGPGAPGAGAPASGENFDQTMAKGFRPGAAGVPPASPPKTAAHSAPASPPVQRPGPKGPETTGPVQRPQLPPQTPAAKQPAANPPATPPKPAAPSPKAPAPQAPAPQPKASNPTPPDAPPPASPPPATPEKPKTVAVRPEDMTPPAATTAAGDDIESLLHQSTPRLFVKGEGLKRPVRLMKASNKIGRAETADVLLPHESVSEQHAELRFDGKQWTLVDCGSTNGCVVDGEHLRSAEKAVRRNSLISIGSLHLIFLCTDKATISQDRRNEDRALQLLTKKGRIDKVTANEIRQMVRTEPSHSIAEIVLRDTPMAPVDWANAVAEAGRKVSFFARILRLFTGGK